MSSGLALQSDPAPILACTVSRRIHHFDLLIEDMEAELGDAWGDLTYEEARAFLGQPDAADLECLVIAMTEEDESDLGQIGEVITTAKAHDIRTLLVTENVSPAALHELLRLGALDFVPYPLNEGALHDAMAKTRKPAAPLALAEPEAPAETPRPDPKPTMQSQAAIFAVQALAGGTGASTLACNLAWELATVDKKAPPTVCLMDFNLQSGSISTYLDLPRREIVIELLQDAQTMDVEAFKQALVSYDGKLSVFTAPPEIMPLDIIGPEEMEAILNLAAQCFDIVVIDMPSTVVMWTETVLNRADVYFATLELDMRSAQNAMRFIKALQSEDLPLEKLNFVLNRAPGMTDLNGKGRAKRLAESLGVTIATNLPDGGKQVAQSGDHGQPIAETAKKNALRKEINKLAVGLHKAMLDDAAALAPKR